MKNTSEIFRRLSKGQFLSSNSLNAEVRALYEDIEENFDEYYQYFLDIDFILSAGSGYYYFSRKESKAGIETKLRAVFNWIDYLDFLKSFDSNLSSGSRLRLAEIEMRLSADIELKDKLAKLYKDKVNNREKLKALMTDMVGKGYAEIINENDEIYQMTMALNYLEELIQCITISEEEDGNNEESK